ncbi:hypothetical protein SAMN05192544_1011167 [Paraburkholderia hospita]|nr:hypothetical protein SAMN05192544_1011167 [Paraburkholderia hospita]
MMSFANSPKWAYSRYAIHTPSLRKSNVLSRHQRLQGLGAAGGTVSGLGWIDANRHLCWL